VLELFDASGHRLAVNRGWHGADPLIDFTVPQNGTYCVRVFDLVYGGGAGHDYRLAVDTGPRIAFGLPAAIERGKSTPVTLYGWNLGGSSQETATGEGPSAAATEGRAPLDTVVVELTVPEGDSSQRLRRSSQQIAVEGFAYCHAGADAPILMGIADVPVLVEQPGPHGPEAPQGIVVPCDLSGRLVGGDEQDWYWLDARRGEVLWLEAFGERLGAPVDLELGVFDTTGSRELATLHDGRASDDCPRFRFSHLDPVGRWVAPDDGRFLLLVRNLIGGLEDDPHRVYRLSVQREDSDVELIAVPRSDDPVGLNLARGGRLVLDILADRRRGLGGDIRVSARSLPPGIECPDVWLGPGVHSVPLILTAGRNANRVIGSLELEGSVGGLGVRKVRGGTVVQKSPHGISSRFSGGISFAVVGEAALSISANGHEPKAHHLYGELPARHAPGSIVDVVVEIDPHDTRLSSPVRLTGSGLPPLVDNRTAVIPAGENRGTISFYLPPALPVGRYSIVVQGETSVPVKSRDAPAARKAGSSKAENKTETVIVFSNPVTIDVQPAGFVVAVDPFTPRQIRRGEIMQLQYSARRINGFINKIHTELDAPGDVIGLRGRGVTFVGQTDTGTIQVIASDDAPLGRQPFLRLFSVGTLEDQPVFQGSCFLDLEIVK
jgi:hypothetical protein